MSCHLRSKTHRLLHRYKGFVSIELVLAIALVGFMAVLAVGTVRSTAEWCTRLSTQSMELREEVWGVGMLQKRHEPLPPPGTPVHAGSPRAGELTEGDMPIEMPMIEGLTRVNLDSRGSETLITCQLRRGSTTWVIGGLQGTRRWRP